MWKDTDHKIQKNSTKTDIKYITSLFACLPTSFGKFNVKKKGVITGEIFNF